MALDLTPRQKAGTGLSAAVLACCIPVIQHFEGLRTASYADPALGWAVPTACWGHTGADVRRGQSFTEDECRDLLSADVGQTWTAIAPCINEPTSDNERGAFVSFSFNVGAANFCGSTIVKKLNAGDHAGACAELSRWVFAGGKQMSGLVRRRAAERALCEGKD